MRREKFYLNKWEFLFMKIDDQKYIISKLLFIFIFSWFWYQYKYDLCAVGVLAH